MKNYNIKNIQSNNTDQILKMLVFCCLKHQMLMLECSYDSMFEKNMNYSILSFMGSVLSNLHACIIICYTIMVYHLSVFHRYEN